MRFKKKKTLIPIFSCIALLNEQKQSENTHYIFLNNIQKEKVKQWRQ